MNHAVLNARLQELAKQPNPATEAAIATVRWLLGTVPVIELRDSGGLIVQWNGSQGHTSVFVEPDGKLWP